MELAGRRMETMRAALDDLRKELWRLRAGTAGSSARPPEALIAEAHLRIGKCHDIAHAALTADSHAQFELTEAADRAAPPFAPWRTGLERPVGIPEIAERLGVKRATVDQWRHREVMPAPAWTVAGRPLWRWADVKTWAEDTGRMPAGSAERTRSA